MKYLLIKILCGALAAGSLLTFTSCGGGSNDDAYNGAAPLSLNGVTLQFNGAKFTFTSPSPNGAENGSETGGIVYEPQSDANFNFSPADPVSVDAVTRKWPEDLGSLTSYQYSHIDGTRGELLIYAYNFESDSFIYHPTAGAYADVFALRFNTDGNTVTDVVAAVTTWALPEGALVPEQFIASFVADPLIGGLTAESQDLPLGWDGSNDGPGFIAPQTFEGLVLTMDEDGSTRQIQLSSFAPVSGIDTINYAGWSRQTGQCTITVSDGATITSYSCNFIHDQLYGTEDVRFEVEYLTAGGTTALPDDETFTFTFLGGDSLTTGSRTTIPVRTGTYVSTERPSGTFILDTRPAIVP